MNNPLRIVACLVAGLLAACGGRRSGEEASETATSTPPSPRSVNVYNWPDYIAPGLLEQFEAETGIKVNYDAFDSNSMLETKMLTGNSGYDVVVPTGPFLQRQVEAGVYRPLDRSQLENYPNLDPDLMAMLAQNDPDNVHAVGYMWGTTGIGYDARKVMALVPDAPTDSWRLVFDPAVASRLAGCGIAFIDAPNEILAIVLMSLDRDPYSTDPADLAAAEAALLAIRPYVRYINSVSLLEDLAGGNVCLVIGWNGDVVRARLRAEEAGLDTDIRYVIPKEGTLSWFDALAIPKDAPHPEEAHAFIDFMLRADVGAKNATSVRYATFNRAALPLLDEAMASDPSIYPVPEVRARLSVTKARSLEDSRVENRIWTRFRTGQ
jgi:putrescine transport system substrate-binding protein